MPLKDILKKKEKIDQTHAAAAAAGQPLQAPPEFKFVRTTTDFQEVIAPPELPGDQAKADSKRASLSTPLSPVPGGRSKQNEGEYINPGKTRRLSNLLSRPSGRASQDESRDGPTSPKLSPEPSSPTSPKNRSEKRLSSRLNDALHISPRSRSGSANLPTDLPEIHVDIANAAQDEKNREAQTQREAQWEKRATLLAQNNMRSRSASASSRPGSATGPTADVLRRSTEEKPAVVVDKADDEKVTYISDEKGDVNIQEAIRLHEAGDLENSTVMFGQLANPDGANNALAQVLYGLALRHGWGIQQDPSRALDYLTFAASNSATVESAALSSGLNSGGAAKGELVLAIYELGNSFRYGWGVQKDPVAARSYFETAAELGDVDAMWEASWCFLEGFGGKKDKFKAAQYLRRAENLGKKEVGNSW
ncbi:MAG: hypothetical protein M1831_000693 [Alyxoria varia]|nr:MAG: hypothetical protein M1831_000693 [Alyxoria varia]